MFDIRNLSITIEGKYEDCFLYNDRLYLVDNRFIQIVDFEKLIDKLAPKSNDQKLLYSFAFYKNDLFFEGQTFANTLLNMSFVRDKLTKVFKKLQKKEVSENLLKKCVIEKIEHGLHGILHFEIYKGKLFASNDKGLFVLRLNNKRIEKRAVQISEDRVLHISASYGSELKISAGLGGYSIFDFDSFKNAIPSIKDIQRDKSIPTIETELSYKDFFVRDINNKLSYIYNVYWKKRNFDYDFAPFSEDDESLEPSIQKYKTAKLFDNKGNILLEGNDYSTVLNHRLLTFNNEKLKIYKMNYRHRERFDAEENISELDHFSLDQVFDIKGDQLSGKIYKTFQTLFGFYIETDKGLYCIDDNPESREPSIYCKRIVREPIFKIRHFYRSLRYSHILAIIKENKLELQADLTDYFFQKSKKKLRLSTPVFRSP